MSVHFTNFPEILAKSIYSSNPSSTTSSISKIAATLLMILQQKSGKTFFFFPSSKPSQILISFYLNFPLQIDDLEFKLDSLKLGDSLLKNWPQIMFGPIANEDINPVSIIPLEIPESLKYIDVGLRIAFIETSILCENILDKEYTSHSHQVMIHGLSTCCSFITSIISKTSDILISQNESSITNPKTNSEYLQKINNMFTFSIQQGKEISASLAEFVISTSKSSDPLTNGLSNQSILEISLPIQLFITIQSFFDDMIVDVDRMVQMVKIFASIINISNNSVSPKLNHPTSENTTHDLFEYSDTLNLISNEVQKFVSSANTLSPNSPEFESWKPVLKSSYYSKLSAV
ncbi:hypothetical protein AYI68_g3280 [Smittium mucronatum]|uniref:Uncharacterized protein n=1 Tax=Smittium mucronatum TaxID=133383 RepID=A0A1R0H0C7_9FUNG|nr:hypothetical protein AYI68_g3280 [Smittium mucronatum]